MYNWQLIDYNNIGYQTTRTETSQPVNEDKSARKRGLVGPYVKTTRTVWKDYSDHQYLLLSYLFFLIKLTEIIKIQSDICQKYWEM